MAPISLPESLLFDLIYDAAHDIDLSTSCDSQFDELSRQLRPSIDKTLNALCDLSEKSRARAISQFKRTASNRPKCITRVQALMHESFDAQTHPVCRKAYMDFLSNSAG